MKRFIKLLIPPIILTVFRKTIPNKYGWKGDYSSWQDAQKDAIGYDSDNILQAVRKSLLKVKNGDAAYERDSVIFDEIQYSWPLLSGLMFCAAKEKGRLKVLDFGGSLGSTYYQNKKFLDKLDYVSWNVVEQMHFVDAGKKEFEDDQLNFFSSVEECLKRESPKILILSSVLQYIEDPYKLLDGILKSEFEYILIDRTPFSKLNSKIKLQIVSPSVYRASYPCHFFKESNFVKYFENHQYKLLEGFNSFDGENNEYEFKGMILERVS